MDELVIFVVSDLTVVAVGQNGNQLLHSITPLQPIAVPTERMDEAEQMIDKAIARLRQDICAVHKEIGSDAATRPNLGRKNDATDAPPAPVD